jgi:hypothetical protein
VAQWVTIEPSQWWLKMVAQWVFSMVAQNGGAMGFLNGGSKWSLIDYKKHAQSMSAQCQESARY